MYEPRYKIEKDWYGYMIFDNITDEYIDLGDGILLDAVEVLAFLNKENIVTFEYNTSEEV